MLFIIPLYLLFLKFIDYTRHTKGSVKRRVLTKGGEQEIKFIPEGDLYRLIVKSQLPTAEKF